MYLTDNTSSKGSHLKLPLGIILCLIIILYSGFILLQSFLNPSTALAAEAIYKAQRIKQSYPGIINAQAGKAFTFWVKYKNIGTATWYNHGDNLVAINNSEPYGRKSAFQHQWWRTWYCPARLLESSVKPGEIGTFRFAMQVPEIPGLYSEKFQLAVKNVDWMPGGNLEIIIRVENPNYKGTPISTVNKKTLAKKLSSETSLSKNHSSPQKKESKIAERIIPKFNPKRYKAKKLEDYEKIDLLQNVYSAGTNQKENRGPEIRIGLYSTQNPIIIKANGHYEIRDNRNKLLVKLTKGEQTTTKFDFDKKRYYLNSDGKRILMTDSYLRFIPKENDIIFEIVSNKNTNTWKNYTKFRGKLEIRLTDEGTLWIINELPMEDYLKGSAEAGNNNPQDYLKAMAIAERTYALYHLLNPTKHAKRNFVLTSHAGDQVYRGYSRELISPNVVSAVEATKGLIVTYDNKIAITPYFSQSDGYTRSWENVWGGEAKPWLKPKYVPYDSGKKMLGHGVGMSAWGAWDMAKNRGYNFEEILKYFYTGVELKRVY